MKKENNNYTAFLITSLLILALMLLGYYCFLFKEMKVYAEYRTIVSTGQVVEDSIHVSDSLRLKEYVLHVDSLFNYYNTLESKYQENVDNMIYKTTQWLTFWLGVMGIVVGALCIIQLYNHHRTEDIYHALRQDINDEVNRISNYANKRIDNSINGFDNRFEAHKKRTNEENAQAMKELYERIGNAEKSIGKIDLQVCRTSSENSIGAIMMCIGSFPDPTMFGSVWEKKKHLRYYLDILSSEFDNYLKGLSNLKELNTDNLNKLSVVLTSLKYVSVRSQNVFSAYSQNFDFSRFNFEITRVTKDIITGSFDYDKSKKDLERISKIFKVLITSIGNDEDMID